MTVGWHGSERIHHCTLHLSIIDDRIHIEANNTDRSLTQAFTQRGIGDHEIAIALNATPADNRGSNEARSSPPTFEQTLSHTPHSAP